MKKTCTVKFKIPIKKLYAIIYTEEPRTNSVYFNCGNNEYKRYFESTNKLKDYSMRYIDCLVEIGVELTTQNGEPIYVPGDYLSIRDDFTVNRFMNEFGKLCLMYNHTKRYAEYINNPVSLKFDSGVYNVYKEYPSGIKLINSFNNKTDAVRLLNENKLYYNLIHLNEKGHFLNKINFVTPLKDMLKMFDYIGMCSRVIMETDEEE